MERGNPVAQKKPTGFSVVLFCGGIFLFWAALYVHVPILPLYSQSLGASMTAVGLIVGAYGFTQLLVRIPLGMLSDKWGRRKPFIMLGVVNAAMGSLGLVLSPNAWFLTLSRAILGLAAASWVTSSVLFASYFGTDRATWSIGFISFVSALAQILATFAGGKIAEDHGLTAPLYTGIVLSVLAAATLQWVPERPAKRNASGSLRQLLSVGRNTTLLRVSTIAALSQYAIYSTYAFVPLHAAKVGASEAQLGFLTAATLASYTLATLGGMSLATKCGERAAVVSGMLLLMAGTSAVPFLRDLSLLGISQVVSGAGRGLSFPVLMALSIKGMPVRQQGSAMGFFQAIYALGMFIGPSCSGVVADSLGLIGAFISTGLLCFLAGLLALFGIPVD